MDTAPRLKNGRFISRECPVCGYGVLQQEGPNAWHCNGLRDPEHENQELVACEYSIYDCEVFNNLPTPPGARRINEKPRT